VGRRVREQRVAEIRAEALQALAHLDVRSVADIDLIALAKRLGVEVVFDGLDGASARVVRLRGDRARITLSDRISDLGAIRFSLAHELAHLILRHVLVLDGDPFLERVCRPLREDGSDLEREASVFAAELLMPESWVRPMCGGSHVSLDTVRSIARTCRTSTLASALRFVELTSECCAVAYCELGRVRWVKRSRAFEHWIPTGRLVDPTSAASDYFRRGAIDDHPRLIGADAWLPRRATDGSGVRIAEHATIVPELGAVFSLLWVPPTEALHLSSAA
jgi:IrrE N-terminal-like domain